MENNNIGHNSEAAGVTIESRLFNSLTKYTDAKGWREKINLPAGSTVRDLIEKLNLPRSEIFLVLCNGNDISPGIVGAEVNLSAVLEDGDVIAFSGPVPFSYGYGAPVV